MQRTFLGNKQQHNDKPMDCQTNLLGKLMGDSPEEIGIAPKEVRTSDFHGMGMSQNPVFGRGGVARVVHCSPALRLHLPGFTFWLSGTNLMMVEGKTLLLTPK